MNYQLNSMKAKIYKGFLHKKDLTNSNMKSVYNDLSLSDRN